jgi:hypothetical protein
VDEFDAFTHIGVASDVAAGCAVGIVVTTNRNTGVQAGRAQIVAGYLSRSSVAQIPVRFFYKS